LANNHLNSQRTKHIDTRQHFVREWVEDEILKIVFTPTINNTADIFTKNTTEEVFHTHATKLVGPIPNKAEMCNFTSARYEDLVLENEGGAQRNTICRNKTTVSKVCSFCSRILASARFYQGLYGTVPFC
jgi:hypothetical protein